MKLMLDYNMNHQKNRTLELVLCKVNGQDLSNASHEESLEVLQTAPEPIIIEVLRRNSNVTPPPPSSTNQPQPQQPSQLNSNNTTNITNHNNNQHNNQAKMRSLSPDMVTTSTQTDAAEDDYCSLLDLQSAASLARIYPFITQPGSLIQPNCRQGVCFSPSLELGLTDLEMANEDDPIYEEPWDLVRPPIIPAFEYEEVILERNSADEKLGLTLCYESHGNEEEDGMDVFVSEIEADSIAANDGRIREGDQILQINNTEVTSRQEAIQLFTEDCQQFTLVLARQILQVDDGFVEDKSCGTYDDLIQEPYHQSAFIHNCHGEEVCSTDTASTSKSKHDSGLGRTDDSIKTEESSEHECLGDCPEKCCHSNDSFTSNETADNHLPHPGLLDNNMYPGYTCDNKLADALSHHNNNSCHGKPPQSPSNKSDSNSYKSMSVSSNSSCHSSPLRQQMETEHIYDEPLLTPPKNVSPSNTYQREISELNKEIENMRMECQKISESNKQELEKCVNPGKTEPLRSPRMVPRMGTRLDYLRQIQAIQQYGQMSSWIRQNQWAGLNDGKENNCLTNQQQGLQNPPFLKPYCVSNLSNVDYPLHPGMTARNGGCDTIERELQYSHDKDVYKDTSTTSAYNTGGESCRSTPLTLELHPQYGDDGGAGYNMSMLSLAITNGGQTPPSDCENKFNEDLSNQTKKKSHGSSSSKSKANKSNLTKSPSSSSVSHMTQTPEPPRPENLQNLYAQYAEVMYTNQANLHHTIMVQQKLFQQQLAKQAKQQQQKERSSKHRKSHDTGERSKGHNNQVNTSQQNSLKHGQQQISPKQRSSSSSSKSQSTQNNSKPSSQSHNSSDVTNGAPAQGSSGSDNGNVQMEWVVKLRPDGSRYIARRPIRSKILKERAKKLAQERCGMTTDDDTMSELKLGRYCRKEDRKRHLEKAKEYKKKKEQLMKQKLESLKENDEQKEPNIIDLSHRKMMKHKNKKVLDDFVTVQEMLVHGNRVEQTGKTPNPLLSVTTV